MAEKLDPTSLLVGGAIGAGITEGINIAVALAQGAPMFGRAAERFTVEDYNPLWLWTMLERKYLFAEVTTDGINVRSEHFGFYTNVEGHRNDMEAFMSISELSDEHGFLVVEICRVTCNTLRIRLDGVQVDMLESFVPYSGPQIGYVSYKIPRST